MLTRQNILDQVVSFYRDGGLPGYGDTNIGPQCSYFATDGGRCAVGVVLTNLGFTAEDVAGFNDENASGVITEFGDRLTSKLAPDVYEEETTHLGSFLTRLQNAHDRVAMNQHKSDEDGGNEWPKDIADLLLESFETLAESEGLTI